MNPTAKKSPDFFGNRKADEIVGKATVPLTVIIEWYFAVSHHTMPIEQLRRNVPKLVKDLKIYLNKFLPLLSSIPKSKKFDAFHFAGQCYRALANVAKLLGETEEAAMWFEKNLELFEAAPADVELTVNKFDISLELLNVLFDLKLKDKSKKCLIRCKELYDLSRNAKCEGDFNWDDHFVKGKLLIENLKERNFEPVAKPYINTLHSALIDAYVRYYSEIDINDDKATYYGIMSMKYTIVYDNCRSVANWIELAIEMSANCRHFGAYRQSYYLLLAAKALLDKSVGTDILGRSDDPYMGDEKYCRSMIDVATVKFLYNYANDPLGEKKKAKGKLMNEKTLIEIEQLGVVKEAVKLPAGQCENFLYYEVVKRSEELLDGVEKRNHTEEMLKALGYEKVAAALMKLKSTY